MRGEPGPFRAAPHADYVLEYRNVVFYREGLGVPGAFPARKGDRGLLTVEGPHGNPSFLRAEGSDGGPDPDDALLRKHRVEVFVLARAGSSSSAAALVGPEKFLEHVLVRLLERHGRMGREWWLHSPWELAGAERRAEARA